MIDTFVTFHVLPGTTAEFEQLHQELLARISTQPGCATIRVRRSAADPLECGALGNGSTTADADADFESLNALFLWSDCTLRVKRDRQSRE
jgi:Antibiotic biosynthesis monooxygenase